MSRKSCMNAEGVKIEIAPVLWQVYGLGANIVELRVEGLGV